MVLSKQLFSSNDHSWATPQDLYEKIDAIFNFRLDPCATEQTAKCAIYFTKEENGLIQDWSSVGNAFVNPPYGRELPHWMKKCWEESQKCITIVMLIPARVDTRYWHDYAFKYAKCICFIKGRIAFEKSEFSSKRNSLVSAPFPSALVVFGSCTQRQVSQLNQFGKVIIIRKILNR
jgi:site-specific DNA-methyltransferase (adenine-specific)